MMPSALWKWIKGLLKVATWSFLLLFRQERRGRRETEVDMFERYGGWRLMGVEGRERGLH